MPGHSGHDFLAWKQSRPWLLKPSAQTDIARLVRSLLTFWVGFSQEGF